MESILSYDLQNQFDDYSGVFTKVLAQGGFTSLFTIGDPVQNRKIEWFEKSLAPASVDQISATGKVITVADGSKFAAGMQLNDVNSDASYEIKSVSGNDLTVAENVAVSGVTTYWVSQPAVVEASTEAANVEADSEVLNNYIQEFRRDPEMSEIAIATPTKDDVGMDYRIEKAMYEIRSDLNDALLRSKAGRIGSKTVAGKMKGLYGFVTANEKVDAEKAVLSYDLLMELFKQVAKAGGRPNTIVTSLKHIKAIQYLMKDYFVADINRAYAGTSVTGIQNPFDNGNILNIVVDEKVPANDIIVIDRSALILRPFAGLGLGVANTTLPGHLGERNTVFGVYTAQFQNIKDNCRILTNIG